MEICGSLLTAPCRHADRLHAVTARGEGCRECLERGDSWIGLRLCLICGHVGCDDASAHQHARGHFVGTGHPLIQPFASTERWVYCYIDDLYFFR